MALLLVDEMSVLEDEVIVQYDLKRKKHVLVFFTVFLFYLFLLT